MSNEILGGSSLPPARTRKLRQQLRDLDNTKQKKLHMCSAIHSGTPQGRAGFQVGNIRR